MSFCRASYGAGSSRGAVTMADLAYILLMLAVFAVLALALAGTERM